jgi:hypothetical protein
MRFYLLLIIFLSHLLFIIFIYTDQKKEIEKLKKENVVKIDNNINNSLLLQEYQMALDSLRKSNPSSADTLSKIIEYYNIN